MHRMYTLWLVLFLVTTARSQDQVFTGCVTDASGEPLIGVNVLEAMSGRGTATDLDGCFELTASGDSLEVFLSLVGYEQQNVFLQARSDNSLIMSPLSKAALDEVVATGYGISRERDIAIRSERKRLSTRRAMDAAPTSGISASPSAPPPPPPPPPPPAPAVMEMSVMSARSAEPSPAAMSYGVTPSREERAGQLTAGEVNDFGKWDMWHDIGGEDLARYHDVWQLFARHRYATLLGYADGTPAAGIPVELQDSKGEVLWRSVTDNTGRAELWAAFELADQTQLKQLSIVADPGTPTTIRTEARAFSGEQGRIQYLELPGPCYANQAIDVAYVVDATGSMSDEISFLQAELADVIGRVKDSLPTADLQLGSVFYRDQGDDYLTRISPFSPKIGQTVAFIKSQRAGGGGDTPEAVEDALIAAVDSLAWRPEASAKILFLVLDAPPHQQEDNLDKLHAVIRRAAEQGIRIIPVACSGIDKSTEYLLRNMALATNGTYTFLTDDSGIGNGHIEPSTDLYDVEKLNDLLVRLTIQFGQPIGCGESLPEPIRPLALTEPTQTEQLRCYPNPTLGPLTVNIAEPGGTLLLNDLYGRVLEARQVAGATVDLDLVQYPAGTYYLNYYPETEDADPITQSVVRTGVR